MMVTTHPAAQWGTECWQASRSFFLTYAGTVLPQTGDFLCRQVTLPRVCFAAERNTCILVRPLQLAAPTPLFRPLQARDDTPSLLSMFSTACDLSPAPTSLLAKDRQGRRTGHREMLEASPQYGGTDRSDPGLSPLKVMVWPLSPSFTPPEAVTQSLGCSPGGSDEQSSWEPPEHGSHCQDLGARHTSIPGPAWSLTSCAASASCKFPLAWTAPSVQRGHRVTVRIKWDSQHQGLCRVPNLLRPAQSNSSFSQCQLRDHHLIHQLLIPASSATCTVGSRSLASH